MKEKPILFSTPMVQAILVGRKTQTRRIVKPQPVKNGIFWSHPGNRPKAKKNTGAISSTCKPDFLWTILCKYSVGDVLFVRETWHPKRHNMPTGFPYEYKATAELDGTPTNEKWKPSIHMPKAAARIWLEVTDIRLERLQDISEGDACAEGVEIEVFDKPKLNHRLKVFVASYVISFIKLWSQINGENSWESNPFVWVIEFKRIER